MRRVYLTAILILIPYIWNPLLAQEKKQAREKKICLTFNELPAAQGFGEVDVEAITYLILEALREYDIKAAGFVVGDNIGDNFDVLGQWLNGGHILGSMTGANHDFLELTIEQQIQEIQRGENAVEPMLKGFGQKKRYFRYPFLHYGADRRSRDETALYLNTQGVKIAHATVVPEDYLYNLSLGKLGKTPDSTAFYQLMNEYFNHIFDQLERCEELALEIANRPIKQILLLRANRLNAVYLEELILALRDNGYTFVSLDEALRDDVYSIPEAYYGTKGVGYLDMISLSDPDLIPAE